MELQVASRYLNTYLAIIPNCLLFRNKLDYTHGKPVFYFNQTPQMFAQQNLKVINTIEVEIERDR